MHYKQNEIHYYHFTISISYKYIKQIKQIKYIHVHGTNLIVLLMPAL